LSLSGGIAVADEDYVKLEIRTETEGDDEVYVETPWAIRVGTNTFRLENSPYFAYRVSFGDIVEAIPQKDVSSFLFKRVVEKSGNRTVRVILDPPSDKSRKSMKVLESLVEMGCSYEGANPGYIAVNIPPEVDLEPVCDFLSKTGQQWEHADPAYDDLYPDDE
jgi:Domain of unknown function (DUF4265)/Uncharacterized protein conserved in bacteria (DUF2314)